MGTTAFRERYIDPCTDFGFKKLFGTELNKELLISFLNALLPDQQDIVDIRYLNTEHLPDQAGRRRSVFDVYCENSRGGRSSWWRCNADCNASSRIAACTTPRILSASKPNWEMSGNIS